MSERNVELMRRMVEAYNARDVDAFIACCEPGAEFRPLLSATVGGSVYHGHEGLRQWFRDLAHAWGDEIRAEPETYFDLGEHTLSFNTFRGRGRQSGAEVAMPVTLVARWRNDLLVYIKGYAHRQEALRDLDVTEDELEPIAP
jgi:ketosteroid isomerase-like protein